MARRSGTSGPAVDLLFKSAADCGAGPHAIAGILTGMGKDGAEGLLRLRAQGATTFGQDEWPRVVYGMPRAAWENGAAERQIALDRIADFIVHPHAPASPHIRCPGHGISPPMSATPSAPAVPSTILIVDDEPVVLAALQQTLEREKFHVVACASPTQGARDPGGARLRRHHLRPEDARDARPGFPDREPPHPPERLAHPDHRGAVAAHDRRRDQQGRNLPVRREAMAARRADRHGAQCRPSPRAGHAQRGAAGRDPAAQRAAHGCERRRSASQVRDLEQQRQRLDAANRELAASYEHSLELCRRILTTYDPILGGQAKALVEFASHDGGDATSLTTRSATPCAPPPGSAISASSACRARCCGRSVRRRTQLTERERDDASQPPGLQPDPRRTGRRSFRASAR